MGISLMDKVDFDSGADVASMTFGVPFSTPGKDGGQALECSRADDAVVRDQ